MRLLTDWFRRYFSDPQIVFLSLLLVAVFAIVLTMGDMLAPVLASIVIAYLLEGVVGMLQRWRLPRMASVMVVYTLFLLFVIFFLFAVTPVVSRQVTQLVQQAPEMIGKGREYLMRLPEISPEIFNERQIEQFIDTMRREIAGTGQRVVSWSLASVVSIITVIVYTILVPLLVFFFLKDRDLILDWFKGYFPKHRNIASTVWKDVDRQIGNYVRGKFWEVLIVWMLSFATFYAFSLPYALLLALAVGLSVIIPIIGASVVTIPVLMVAWFEWGWSSQFIWLAIAYGVIQALDGNVIVPLIFSEAVNLHPVAIIVAILVFGGLWGFWGVFFAIPLATLVQAILSAWPRHDTDAAPTPASGESTNNNAQVNL